MTTILPFDEIPHNELSLVERLEVYEPKSDLMRIDLLKKHSQNIAMLVHRDAMNLEYHTDKDMDWDNWKRSVSSAARKSWAEIAPIIYHNY